MKRKQIPALLMLTAAAVTAIIVYARHMGLKVMVIALLVVLIVFYIIGTGIKMVLDSFEQKNSEQVSDEGEVIEKNDAPEFGEDPEDFGTEEDTERPGRGQ
ncbi:MAG: hypothetical protein K6E32_02785 [Lachnospiraceae bacterium]|nr:hypothetical protein [Lachnospiraceae bacterium]